MTISEVLRVPEAALYSTFGLAILGVLSLTRTKTGSSLFPLVAGDLLFGSTAMSLLLTSNSLGVSTMYEHLSQNVLQAFTGKLGNN